MTLTPSQAAKMRELVKTLHLATLRTEQCHAEEWEEMDEACNVVERQLDAYITSLTASAQTGE